MADSDQENCAQSRSTTSLYPRELTRRLNDSFRQTLWGGRVMLTSGVSELGADAVRSNVTLVRKFDGFNPDNDLYGEHDFGFVDWRDHRILWKIDCYDLRLEFGSPDPAKPAVTTRVLTIRLASEY
jgi:hypothetical protein